MRTCSPLFRIYAIGTRKVKILVDFAMSDSDINTVIDQLSQASVDGAATLSFAGRGLKLDSEADGRLCGRLAKISACMGPAFIAVFCRIQHHIICEISTQITNVHVTCRHTQHVVFPDIIYTGVTNYHIGPHRTTSDPPGTL